MANPICPNTNLQDWKTLVSALVDEYGEDGAKDRAYLAFFRHNADEPTAVNIPSVDEAKGWLTPKKDAEAGIPTAEKQDAVLHSEEATPPEWSDILDPKRSVADKTQVPHTPEEIAGAVISHFEGETDAAEGKGTTEKSVGGEQEQAESGQAGKDGPRGKSDADNPRETPSGKVAQSAADKGDQPKAATDASGTGDKEGQPDIKGDKPENRSKIGKSIEQKAIEKGLVDSFDRTATFDKKTVEDQKERVSQLVTDPDKVKNIIQGKERLPRGIDPSMFIRGVELYADTLPESEQVQLKYELGNSDIVRQTSEAAQTLRFAQEREQDSTTKAIDEVRKARTAEIQNILKGRAIETAIKEEAGKLAAMVKDAKGIAQKKASTRAVWSDFIQSLQC